MTSTSIPITCNNATIHNNSISYIMVFIRDLLLILPLALMVIVELGFALQQPISSWCLPVAIFITLIITSYIHSPTHNSQFAMTLLSAVLMFSLTLLVSLILVDTFYDSRAYHSRATFALADGWNPLLQPNPCHWNKAYCHELEWILQHYPKAQWYWYASTYKLFHSIEAGKSINQLLNILAIIVAWQFFSRLLPKQHRITIIMLTMAVAINPISLLQAASGYVDGAMAATLSIYIILMLGYFIFAERSWLHRGCLIIPYLVNLKFTGLLYGIVFATIVMMSFIYKKHLLRHYFITNFSVFTIAVMLLGFNPYVTNSIGFGHPFYPIMGKGQIYDVSGISDQAFLAKNNFEKFFYTLFTIQDNSNNGELVQVWPFTRVKGFFTSVDSRFSGFGPLFSGIFIIAIGQLLAMIVSLTVQYPYRYGKIFNNDHNKFGSPEMNRITLPEPVEGNVGFDKPSLHCQSYRLQDYHKFMPLSWLLVIWGTFATIFMTPVGWWARLSPQVWLFVCWVEVGTYFTSESLLWRRLTTAVVLMQVLNTFLAGVLLLTTQVAVTGKFFYDSLQAIIEHKPIRIVTDARDHFTLHNTRKVADLWGDLVSIRPHCANIITGNPLFEICAPTPVVTNNIRQFILDQQHTGKPLLFSRGGHGNSYVLDGWSNAEVNGIWTNGYKSRVLMPIQINSNQQLGIELLLHPFIQAQQSQITFAVRVNGQIYKQIKLVQNVPTKIWFVVPLKSAVGNLAWVDVQLEITNPASPKDLGLSLDSRLLGVKLTAITLHWITIGVDHNTHDL